MGYPLKAYERTGLITEDTRTAITRAIYLANHQEYQCKDVKAFGGNGQIGSEGSWPVCWDNWETQKHPSGPECNIYSFGINGDFSFDDSIHAKTGCSVYSFDPSMKGWVTHERAPHMQFISEALNGVAGPTLKLDSGDEIAWKAETLKGFMDRFKHQEINYLKVDVEFSEWSAFRTALLDGTFNKVNQLAIEIHFWKRSKEPEAKMVDGWNQVMEGLHAAGFRMWYRHTNPMSTSENFDLGFNIPCCYEMAYVKIK